MLNNSLEQKNKKKRGETAPISKSKYEFNLAEFPIGYLSKQIPKKGDAKVIRYEDTINDENGKEVARKWMISPSAQYGWGSPGTLSLVFELFQIWKEQGFNSPVITFESIYNLIKRMGLKDQTTAYKRIRRDLNSLVGLTFEAKNSFWDNELKAYVDETGHFFEYVRTYTREGPVGQTMLPFAHIKASPKLWGSVEANAIMTLRIGSGVFHSYTPTEQRIALYLGKRLYTGRELRREVKVFGQQLPLFTKQYKDLKKRITKACDGLISKGFPNLTSYRYEKSRAGRGEIIIFERKGDSIPLHQYTSTPSDHPTSTPSEFFTSPPASDKEAMVKITVEDILDVTKDPHSIGFYRLVAQRMDRVSIARALSEAKQEGKDPAKFFTFLIKKYALEQGIELST